MNYKTYAHFDHKVAKMDNTVSQWITIVLTLDNHEVECTFVP